VAVSKTKPNELLQEVYDAGQRAFGENYVQELVEKAPALPADIEWHFIGKLQSNKCKMLVQGVPNLRVLETLDSEKLANKLQTAVVNSTRDTPLGVMIQVNTSPWEGTKNGILPEDVPAVAQHLARACPNLELLGLMTIGAPGEASCFETCAAAATRWRTSLGCRRGGSRSRWACREILRRRSSPAPIQCVSARRSLAHGTTRQRRRELGTLPPCVGRCVHAQRYREQAMCTRAATAGADERCEASMLVCRAYAA